MVQSRGRLGKFDMARWVEKWVNVKVDDGDLIVTGGTRRFATRMAFRITVFANLANIAAHWALNATGLLPYPLHQALIVGLVITTVIAGPVSYLIILLVGDAIQALAINRNEFARLSSTDSLSGLMNRRAFFNALQAHQAAGVLLLVDIDQFKKVNDTYGHLAGDDVICAVGKLLVDVFGNATDLIARIGGEEFAVFVPDLDGLRGTLVADQARRRICSSAVQTRSGPVSVAISVGVAEAGSRRSTEEMYKSCDSALYLAKASGRNTVVHEDAISDLRMRSPFAGSTTVETKSSIAAAG
jgi:diguanylate cyclase (GGDEF)-like protein